MDDQHPPPEPAVHEDDASRYSSSSCRDAADTQNYLTSCTAAETESQTQVSPSQDDECPMDTSEGTTPGDPTAITSDVSSISGIKVEDAAAPETSNSASSSRACDFPFSVPLSRAKPASNLGRKSRSVQELPSQPDESPWETMTASLEMLAVSDDLTPAPVRPPRSTSPSQPPAKAQRSSSGRRRPSTDQQVGEPDHRASPPPFQPVRGSSRGRASVRPSTARPSPSGTVSSRPPGRGTRSSRGTGRARARAARRRSLVLPGSLPQVPTSRLPRETPDGFTHYLINSHPWARFVNPRPVRMLRENLPRVITTLDTETYRHLPDSGYLSLRFNKSLFPQVVFRADQPPTELPFIELQHLEDTVAFRARSQAVIDQVLSNTYVNIDVRDVPETLCTEHPYVTVPPLKDGYRPVLYQVVSTAWGTGVILEAKDLFTVGPDRRDLHCIILDQYAIEFLAGGRGFNKPLVSVKDFVWVYDVKPTRQALLNPQATLQQARIPRTTALATTSLFFFRVSHFALVAPRNQPRPLYGMVLSLVTRREQVTHVRAAFEGCPDAVTFTSYITSFPLHQLSQYEIITARSRVNVSSAMRFSEPPVSLQAREQLASLVRRFLPMHPEEGLLPLQVFKATAEEQAWFQDRLGAFESYNTDPVGSKVKMGKLYSAACAALAAVNTADDDRRSHFVVTAVTTPVWYPLRLRFFLTEMPSEGGWGIGRHAVIWVTGSTYLIQVKIVQVTALAQQRALEVIVEAFRWSHKSLERALEKHGRVVDTERIADICVRLVKSSAAVDPIFELVSRSRMFADIQPTSIGHQIVDLIFKRTQQGPEEPQPQREPPPVVEQAVTVRGRSLTLTPDQREAVRLGSTQLPIVAIQAAFGTGKTLIGAVIAALSSAGKDSTVLVTTSTNAAVAQFTETLLSLNDFSDLRIVRHISDTAAAGNLTPTPVDLSKILKTLGEQFGDQLDESEREACDDFKSHRERLEEYIDHPERVPEMSDDDKEQYEIAEELVSRTLKRMVRIMFKVRRPSVICMTTASLINSTGGSSGIFTPYIPSFQAIIGDEASQIPEPALLALVGRFPDARHVYIGDVHQLAPHARCPHNSNPALYGARSLMATLLHAPAVPVAPLITTFRSHPALVQLPNQVAYNGALTSGTPAAARRMLLDIMRFPNADVPFMFVDVPGESVRAPSKSYQNFSEAVVCRNLLGRLIHTGVNPRHICVITFYREQFRQLKTDLDIMHVELTTVDSVQGREKEVVVLLTTKTDFTPDSAEFLDDYRRLNVAISRCRHGLFILGHASSLRTIPSWNRVLQWADSLNAVVPAHDFARFMRSVR